MPPVTPFVDAAFPIKELLANNWNPANTRSVTPVFSTGWFAENKATQAQLTVTNPRDGRVFRGLTANGVGQRRRGTVQANHWIPHGLVVLGSEVDSGGAKKLGELFVRESNRILMSNQTAFADFDHVEPDEANLFVESDRKPTQYRWNVPIGFYWWNLP